jgi:hypothetical protein
MKAGPYRLETYGVSREESPRSCATRLARILSGLVLIHPAFGRWNQQGHTGSEWSVPFCAMPPNIDELTSIFEKGRHYRDITHELMSEAGFSVSAWNGMEGPLGVSMRLNVGSYWDRPDFPNQIDFELGDLEPASAGFIDKVVLKASLLAVVEAWEPSWASLACLNYSKKFFASLPPPPFRSGWMTYLSAPYARKITPPSSAITRTVAGGGILILATNEPFTLDNPQHVAVADAIQACLEPLQSGPRLSTSAV